jgi:hypothetical protein
MLVTRQHVIEVLRTAGFAEVADEVSRVLPDQIDLDDLEGILIPYGISRDVLTSRMGGSP